jgi:hypothetical protein
MLVFSMECCESSKRKVERQEGGRMRSRIERSERKFSVPFSIFSSCSGSPTHQLASFCSFSFPLKFKGHQNRSAVLKLFRVKIILHSARVFLALSADFLPPHTESLHRAPIIALDPKKEFLVVLSLCVAHDFLASSPPRLSG